MKKQTSTKIAKASILFYVVSVIFLFIGAYVVFMTYETVVAYNESYGSSMQDVLGFYFTNTASYFAYAFLLYGVGMILKKFSEMSNALTDLMDNAMVTEEIEEVLIDDVTPREITEPDMEEALCEPLVEEDRTVNDDSINETESNEANEA